MAIPTFDRMLQPILALATREPISRKTATLAMEAHFSLSEEERAARIPSGQATYVRHRVGWAMTDLLKAELLEKCGPRMYRATQEGVIFLQRHPNFIAVADLDTLPAFQAWRKTFGTKTDTTPKPVSPSEVETTPIEDVGRRHRDAQRRPAFAAT